MKFSNGTVGFLNIITLLISLAVIGLGLYFGVSGGGTRCEKFLELPILALGLALFLVSVLGLFGSCCGLTSLLWIYLIVLFLLILSMVAFTLFVFIVTNKAAGDIVSGKEGKDLKLGDYSNWLQIRVTDDKTWNEIQGCMKASKLCTGLEGIQDHEFIKKKISNLLAGCCRPPEDCGFIAKNSSYWEAPPGGQKKTKDSDDCKAWSNEQDQQCFGCKACKVGLLATLKQEWKIIAIFNGCLVGLLLVIYCFSCCALRNNRSRKRYSHYYQGHYQGHYR